jgi:DNA-binding NtrC family response regulator/tetratricopeptide (TPR) repeat protein
VVLFPTFSYRRIEPSGEEIRAGAWRIVPLLDLISEKRFLLFRLKSRARDQLLPSVFTFRCEAASLLAPGSCPTVVSSAVEGDRVEFLTDHFDVLTRETLVEDDLPELFEMVFRTLCAFDHHQFQCSDLFPETIGRAPGGNYYVLPNAYALPYAYRDGSLTPSSLKTDLSANWRSLDPSFGGGEGLIHTTLVRKLILHVLAGDTSGVDRAPAGFRGRLLETSEAISRSEIVDLENAYQAVFGRTPLKSDGRVHTHDATIDPAIENQVDGVLERAAIEGSITLVRGDSYTGKTRMLKRAAALLDRSEAFEAVPVDEWDLFAKSWKKNVRRRKPSAHAVWLIDDIEEKALPYSDFATTLLESPDLLKGSIVMAVRSNGASEEVESFLAALRTRRGELFREILTESGTAPREAARLSAYLRAAISRLNPASPPDDSARPEDLVRVLLDCLKREERQMLEFLAVAHFAMPLDTVLAGFSESPRDTFAAVLRLAWLGAIDLPYRHAPTGNEISLYLRFESTALRRLVYDNIDAARREKLHRMIAMLGEQQEGFPKYLLLFHCLHSHDETLAPRHAVAYLRETKSDRRHPYLVSLCADLARNRRLTGLAFADRIFANHELSAHLLREGRTDEAEALLSRSLELFDGAGEDKTLKNAPLLSATFRSLADRWEARGEFKRALALLERAREELQAVLSIPDQAQLLNDLGWLQYRLGDYAKSMESCRLSLNTLSANQYPLIVAQALNLMGVVHFNTSRYDEAVSYYEQSAHLRERAGDENALAASYNNLALAYQSKGQIEKAFDYHDRSLKLKKRQNNKPGIAAGYLNLAFLHLEARNFKEAEERCRESLAICEELGNVQLAADNYTTLGDIALENGHLDQAEHHYQESRRISHQREAINEEMGALRRLSSLCIKQKRYDEARAFAESALSLVQRIGSKYEMAQIEGVLGDLEFEQHHHAEALEHYEKASREHIALSKYRLAATLLSKIGLVHVKTGNTAEARHAFERAQEFVRSDIGSELPQEFVGLQQAVRTAPARSAVTGGESNKLLEAFQELSALTDHAGDPRDFIRKTISAAKRVADPVESLLALKTADNHFVVYDGSGERRPPLERATEASLLRALLRGVIADTASPEIADILAAGGSPRARGLVCIPLKAMNENLGCLLLYVEEENARISSDDAGFLTWLGRQVAGSLKLMLHLNENFLHDGTDEANAAGASDMYELDTLIGKSEAMKRIFRTLEKVRDVDAGILILGESGTGKSALARVIHHNSPRRPRPFQEIHCAQIPHNLLESELFGHERGAFTGAVQRKIGLCEAAHGGTVFLDDINVMPVETQTKLLHFIESKSFMRLGGTQKLRADVRIVAASNEDLEVLCKAGRFREDLYYRLKVILIELPPIRDRKEDMVAIALDYLRRSCSKKNIPLKRLSPETIQLLQKAPWRGNVRELQNVLERVVVLSDDQLITPSSLPDDFLKEMSGSNRQTRERLDELVDEIIRLGNYSELNPLLPVLEAMLAKRMVSHVAEKTRAARLLGISKPTLYARLKDFDRAS